MAREIGRAELRERPMGELVQQLTEQSATLVRKELELAKAELTAKGKQAGTGAGMFGAAGALGLFALGALTAALILLLATAVAPWLAALIVAGGYATAAGVMALHGRNRVQAATPPVPDQAMDSTKEDVRWVKAQAKTARQ